MAQNLVVKFWMLSIESKGLKRENMIIYNVKSDSNNNIDINCSTPPKKRKLKEG